MDYLRTFIAVADKRSFAKAADLLFMTQPTVTRQIQKLEKDLDIQLFHRSSHSVELTDNGIIFLEYARQIVALEDAALTEMRTQHKIQKDVFLCAAHAVSIKWGIKKALLELEAQTGIHVNLDLSTNTELVRQQVQYGEYDFGILRESVNTSDQQFSRLTIHNEDLVLLAPSDYLLSDREPVDFARLQKLDILLPEQSEAIITAFLDYCKADNVRPRSIHYLFSLELILDYVSAGLGCGIFPKDRALAAGHKDLQILEPDRPLRTYVNVICTPQRRGTLEQIFRGLEAYYANQN